MKTTLFIISLLGFIACDSRETKARYKKTASLVPEEYLGQWVSRTPFGGGSQVVQTSVTIYPSGDSLLWMHAVNYVDTAGKKADRLWAGKIDDVACFWDVEKRVLLCGRPDLATMTYDTLRLKGQSMQLTGNTKPPFADPLYRASLVTLRRRDEPVIVGSR